MNKDMEKQAAARRSLEFVRDGDVVGLGSGSTASYAIRMLADRVREGLDIRAVATSVRSRELAVQQGISLTTLEECSRIDVLIDGADEIDPGLALIKGGGGALLREKIVASASRKVIIIADSGKQVAVLGRFPLPVEAVPFARVLLAERIAALGAAVTLRRDGEGRPFVTDGGHYILDCAFGRIPDPAQLADKLDHMTGLVEHGLFLGMADMALIGKGSEVIELRRGS